MHGVIFYAEGKGGGGGGGGGKGRKREGEEEGREGRTEYNCVSPTNQPVLISQCTISPMGLRLFGKHSELPNSTTIVCHYTWAVHKNAFLGHDL